MRKIKIFLGVAFLLIMFDAQAQTWQWSKGIGGTLSDGSSDICNDISGNVYIGGTYISNPYYFGNDSLICVPSMPERGFYLAKYNSSGSIQWLRGYKGTSEDSLYAGIADIAYDSINNYIYVCGNYAGSGNIDGVSLPQVTGLHILLWLRNFGSSTSNVSYDFSLDNSGNIYVGGSFADTGFFGIDTLSSNSSNDAFIVKYDINGNYQWVRQSHATVNAIGYNVSSDGNGKVYSVGYFSGDASFGIYNVTASSSRDFYIARYSTNGTCLGVVTFSNFGTTEIYTNGVTQDANGNPCIAGVFAAPLTIGSFNFTSHGADDIFVAKLDAIVGEEDAPRLANSNQLSIYANPTTGKCTVSVPQDFLNESNLVLSIFDSKGSLIQRTTLEMNDGKIKLNIEAQARGVYNAVLSNGKKNYSGRIVFE